MASGVCALRNDELECELFQWCGFGLVCFPDTFFGDMPLGWLFSLDGVELFVQNVMDWALECNNYTIHFKF